MSYFGIQGLQCQVDDSLRTGGFVDIPRLISFLKTRSYMGRGIEFKHKNPEVHKKWHEFVELNQFYDFMFRETRTKCENGATFITIDKSKEDGKVLLGSASPLMTNGIGFSFATPTCAVIIRQISIANRPIYVRSVYDTKKVVNTFWTRDQYGKETLYDKSFEIDKELQIELGTYNDKDGSWTYVHDWGFVPVIVIYNEPFSPTMPMLTAGFYVQSPFTTNQNLGVVGFDYRTVKDTGKCGKLILQLDNLYIHMNRLIELFKPKLIISTNNAIDGNKYMKKKIEEQGQSANNEDIQNADVFVSNGANKIQVDQIATPNTIDNYQNQIVATYIDIFKCCGLSFVTQSGTQKTGQESYTQYRGDIEQVNFDRNYLTSKWIEVIVKAFSVMGIDLNENREDWSFQVKKNLATDESNLIDNLVKQYSMKLKTPAQIIAEIEGIDTDYAEHIVEENFKWFDEHKEETTQPQINPPENANVSGVKMASLQGSKEKGGRPQGDKE